MFPWAVPHQTTGLLLLSSTLFLWLQSFQHVDTKYLPCTPVQGYQFPSRIASTVVAIETVAKHPNMCSLCGVLHHANLEPLGGEKFAHSMP